MNTTEKGNRFEAIAYNIIKKAIAEKKLGVDPAFTHIHQKKGYYSDKRKSNIIFDLSIEVIPPGADRPIITYFVECKDYNHKIPVDDVTLHNGYIQEVSGVNAKGVFIARGGFQSGAFTSAESYGMMLISVEREDKYDILLYSRSRGLLLKEDKSVSDKHFNSDIFLYNLQKLFSNISIERNIKKLSKTDINGIVEQELNNYNPSFISSDIHSISFSKLAKYISSEYQVTVLEDSINNTDNVFGIYNAKDSIILINKKLSSEKKAFVLAHEFGHLVLHKNTIMTQSEYELFADSEKNFKTGKHDLKNPKNWIEWQANYFAASLLMHRQQIENVQYFHQKRTYGRFGNLYLDDQSHNVKEFYDTIKKMAYLLGVSKTSLIYRLKEFSLITDKSRLKNIKQIIEEHNDELFF